MKRLELVAYAADFVSLLLEDEKAGNIGKIVLFGSVARGDFDEESDVDIFVDIAEKDTGFIERRLKLFEQSEMHRLWVLKGVKNKISLKVGELSRSPLRRSITSNGVILYGKYKDIPEKPKHWLLMALSFKKTPRKENVRLWKKLYGYSQKIKGKEYDFKGMLEELGGKRIEKNVIIVPMEKRSEILEFTRANKVDYTLSEIWSDEL